jgi:MYXO-CTERM domain-containing protein
MLRCIVITLGLLLPTSAAWACDAEVRPLCGRSLWVAPVLTDTPTVPGSSQALELPMELVGVAQWGQAAGCAAPTDGILALSILCETASGDAVHNAVDEIVLAAPTTPGLLGLAVPSELTTVAAGLVTEALSCTLSGTLELTFAADATGSGSADTAFDLDFSVLAQSTNDPARPSLGLRQVVPGGGHTTGRAGDELLLWYAVENNQDDAATVDLALSAVQVAGEPEGTDPDGMGFALGGAAGSSLDVLFAEDVTAELIGGGDPSAPNNTASLQLDLGPGEAALVPVIVRSAARCRDDAASLIELSAAAAWGSDQADVHVQSVLRTGIATPASPLCSVSDSISTADTVDAAWGPAIIDDTPWLAGHAGGNLSTPAGARTRVPGFLFPELHPNPSLDSVRTELHPNTLRWTAEITPTQTAAAYEPRTVEFSATNLLGADVLNLPAVYSTIDTAGTGVALDAATGQLTFTATDAGDVLFEGTHAEFSANTPPGLTMDLNTIRAFTFACEDLPAAVLLPDDGPLVATLDALDDSVSIELFDRRSGSQLAWTASVVDGPATVPAISGLAGTPITVTADVSALPEWPRRAFVRVSVATDAINSPAEIPLLLSRTPGDDDDSSDDDDSVQPDDDDATAADDDDLSLGPDGDGGCACSSSQRTPAGLLALLLIGARRRWS